MKISHYILLSFFIILLLFSFTTYINSKQAEAVQDNTEFVAKSGQILRTTNRFQRNILNMVSGLRGYLLTGERYFIDAYDTAAQENGIILEELSRLIPDSSAQKKRLVEIQTLNNKWVEDYAEPLRQAKMLAIGNDSNLQKFTKIYREKLSSGDEKFIQQLLQDRFRVFSNKEYEFREQRREELNKTVNKTRRLSILLTASSVAISIIIVLFLAYRISARITMMVKLANEISTGNYLVQIRDEGKDELRKLSDSLNHMAKTLSENISLLKRKNEELDQFAHIVSHDLKGPLRGIDNVVTWIEEDHLEEMTPKVRDYFDLIRGRIVRAENLIEGILSYARVGKETITEETVAVTPLVEEIVDTLSVNPAIRILIEPNMPVLHTERLPLLQIFSNLVSNAVKYHDKEHGLVRVYHKANPDKYEFYVEDDGPGIAKTYHDKIFVIFQTLKDRDSFESTGVGLAIVKKILDERKERISIKSEPGKGSVFSFTWSKK
ncbi:MAG: HAMP domain-containing protein [Chitinophagaceae bacterium]|nr:MAG: HAMP domain-containing protein [Chitinophagaceae bacterium]